MVNLLKPLIAGAAATLMAAAPVHADKPPTFIVGTPRNDWLVGSRHPDVILARAGDDRLFGRRGNDILVGGDGDDHLFAWGPIGRSGADLLRGGRGFDRCVGDPADRFINCEVIRIRG